MMFTLSTEMAKLRRRLDDRGLGQIAQFRLHSHEIDPNTGKHGSIIAFPQGKVEIYGPQGTRYKDNVPEGSLVTGYNVNGPCYGLESIGIEISEGAKLQIELLRQRFPHFREAMLDYFRDYPALEPLAMEHTIITDTHLVDGILQLRTPGMNIVETQNGGLHQLTQDKTPKGSGMAIVGFLPGGRDLQNCHAWYGRVDSIGPHV
jgi:hypothetical protein